MASCFLLPSRRRLAFRETNAWFSQCGLRSLFWLATSVLCALGGCGIYLAITILARILALLLIFGAVIYKASRVGFIIFTASRVFMGSMGLFDWWRDKFVFGHFLSHGTLNHNVDGLKTNSVSIFSALFACFSGYWWGQLGMTPKVGKTNDCDVQRKYMHSTQTVPMLWNTSKSCLLKHQPSTQQRSIVHFQQCIYHEACNLVTSRPFMHFCSAAWQLPWCYFISSTHVFSAWMMSLIWTRFVRFFPAFVLRPKAATFNTYLFRHTSCNPYGRVMQSHSLSINYSHHLAT